MIEFVQDRRQVPRLENSRALDRICRYGLVWRDVVFLWHGVRVALHAMM